jgi:hypothetical protein
MTDTYLCTSPAPGAPGIAPTWCSSDKDLVGTATGPCGEAGEGLADALLEKGVHLVGDARVFGQYATKPRSPATIATTRKITAP